MSDNKEINEKQEEQVNGGSGYAMPGTTGNCPKCGSDNVIFDKSVYLPEKGQMTYHFICLDCTHRFTKN